MSVIFFLIVVGIVVAGGFLAAFIWSVKSGQYDDSYTPSVRILFDEFKSDGDSPSHNEIQSKEENHSKKIKTKSNK